MPGRKRKSILPCVYWKFIHRRATSFVVDRSLPSQRSSIVITSVTRTGLIPSGGASLLTSRRWFVQSRISKGACRIFSRKTLFLFAQLRYRDDYRNSLLFNARNVCGGVRRVAHVTRTYEIGYEIWPVGFGSVGQLGWIHDREQPPRFVVWRIYHLRAARYRRANRIYFFFFLFFYIFSTQTSAWIKRNVYVPEKRAGLLVLIRRIISEPELFFLVCEDTLFYDIFRARENINDCYKI